MSEIEQGIPTAIPDILTPGQYYEGAHRDDPETQAVKRLMFAVLTDAVRCFRIYCRAESRFGRQMFYEAQGWIWDRHSEGPFTFEAICETLEIEPERMRRGLREWRVHRSREIDSNSLRLPRRARVRAMGPITSPRPPHGRIHSADIDHEMPSQFNHLEAAQEVFYPTADLQCHSRRDIPYRALRGNRSQRNHYERASRVCCGGYRRAHPE